MNNSTYGAWPVAEPFEEWACCRCHQTRYWFYRAWFHHKTLLWDHNDIEYYKSATGYFIDDHPASQWPLIYSRVWGTRGWQLVLSATQSLSIRAQCERYEAALRAEEESIAAAQQLSHTPVPRRGQKRQAVDNLEHLTVYSIKLKPSCRISLSLMSPRYLCFRAYPLHRKNNSFAGLSTLSIRIVMNFTKLANHMILPSIRAAPPQPLRPPLAKLHPPILSAKALDLHFPYPIQDLCL